MVSGVGVVDRMVAKSRQLSRCQGELLALVHEVSGATPQAGFAAVEVAFALTLTRFAAERHVRLAAELCERLPQVLAALSKGDIDLSKACVFVDVLTALDTDLARRIAAAVLPKAPEKTTGQLRQMLRRKALAADPAFTTARRQRSAAQRNVQLHADDEGTASLVAFGLDATRATAAFQRIGTIARGRRLAGCPGKLEQLRADVMLELLEGQHQTAPAGVIHLDVSLETLALARNSPATLGAYGPVAADIARQFAEAHPGFQWQFAIRDPDGTLLQQGLTRARPDVQPGRSGRSSSAQPTHTASSHAATRDATASSRFASGDATGSSRAASRDATVSSRFASGDATGSSRAASGDATGSSRAASGDATASSRAASGDATDSPGHGGSAAPQRRDRQMEKAADAGVLSPDVPERDISSKLGRLGEESEATMRANSAGPQSSGTMGGNSAEAEAVGTMVASAAGPQPDRPDATRLRSSPETSPGDSAQVRAPTQDPRARFASAAMTRWIRARDRTCRAPGCRMPAVRCQLDHTIRYADGGLTAHGNLCALCEYHHLAKDESGWTVVQTRPGHLRWISPLGRVYETGPEPP